MAKTRLELKLDEQETVTSLGRKVQQLLATLNESLERPVVYRLYGPHVTDSYVEFAEDGTIKKSVNGVISDL